MRRISTPETGEPGLKFVEECFVFNDGGVWPPAKRLLGKERDISAGRQRQEMNLGARSFEKVQGRDAHRSGRTKHDGGPRSHQCAHWK